ncbi:hypothetical protein KFE25_003303 [Diacronema lutheri]|uniref:Uncharacterized protein n=1 Tax=Diacronema lutheri TaxID=2081491 RepID=A0A7R9URG1_DIALT|nr:hypothetical protein KFE25_003303 [Diacronema lutheri]|mmetsp:Transcript_21576/g.66927  ORF Transcript_21576/g.66927 Transcript_21576/m.66927 type:complete len:334 (+) Transcript_21576:33-1034(+)
MGSGGSALEPKRVAPRGAPKPQLTASPSRPPALAAELPAGVGGVRDERQPRPEPAPALPLPTLVGELPADAGAVCDGSEPLPSSPPLPAAEARHAQPAVPPASVDPTLASTLADQPPPAPPELDVSALLQPFVSQPRVRSRTYAEVPIDNLAAAPNAPKPRRRNMSEGAVPIDAQSLSPLTASILATPGRQRAAAFASEGNGERHATLALPAKAVERYVQAILAAEGDVLPGNRRRAHTYSEVRLPVMHEMLAADGSALAPHAVQTKRRVASEAEVDLHGRAPPLGRVTAPRSRQRGGHFELPRMVELCPSGNMAGAPLAEAAPANAAPTCAA